MQIIDTIKNCNGCEACVVGCKYVCVKMVEDENGVKYPNVNENGCSKCNACKLFCPVFNPVELPEFEDFFEPTEEILNREMSKVYRETMRNIKAGQKTEFVGTLCQIAALKSLLGDKLSHNLVIYPLHCDRDNPKRPECNTCIFYK